MAVYGQLAAHSYVEPAPFVCRVPVTGVLRAPDARAEQISQLLLGEVFHLLEINEAWAWGYCDHDRYVGYVAAESLSARVADTDADQTPGADQTSGATTPSHWICAPQALVFSGPSIKTALRLTVPMGARLCLSRHDEKFFALPKSSFCPGGGFIHHRHVQTLGEWQKDPAAVAESLLGTPYLWGGRTRAGIDCSSLIQIALMACGIAAPRDSDQQQALGHPVPQEEWSSLKRGDFVFFPGHVGIMADANQLIHANAYWMNTVIEPLADVVERLRAATDKPILCVRRL